MGRSARRKAAFYTEHYKHRKKKSSHPHTSSGIRTHDTSVWTRKRPRPLWSAHSTHDKQHFGDLGSCLAVIRYLIFLTYIFKIYSLKFAYYVSLPCDGSNLCTLNLWKIHPSQHICNNNWLHTSALEAIVRHFVYSFIFCWVCTVVNTYTVFLVKYLA
jgi:hypothetical protein